MDKPYRSERAAERALKEGIAGALELVGADLTGKAQREAPKDTGALRASAQWQVDGKASFIASSRAYDSIELKISFNIPYAAVQHERTDFDHRAGKAKYLADPMRSNALRYKPLIAATIKQRLASRL